MNAAHLHLLLNHLPIFGLIFATIWLLAALILRKTQLRNAALLSLVAVAVLTLPAYLTGEGAEEMIEHGYNVSHEALEEHEHSAFPALLVTLGCGLIAGITWFMNRKGMFAWLNLLTAAWAIAAIVSMARVGGLGGEISHPEIRGAATTEVPTMDQDND